MAGRRGWTAPQANAFRAAAQHVTGPAAKDIPALVATLGAVQAQDYYGALWAVAQRTGQDAAKVEKSFDSGQLIRTHLMRPTWHFVAPEDLRWLLQLTGERVRRFNGTIYRKLGLEVKHFKQANRVLERELSGRHVARPRLVEALKKARIDTSDFRLVHLLMDAELTGLICSGPRVGKQFTYALLEERVPQARPMDQEEALIELARRYFSTRGPAAVQDFAWWSGLTVSDGKRAMAALGKEFMEVEIDGRTLFLPKDAEPPPPLRNTVRLLPNYDEYGIGFKDRSLFHDPAGGSTAQLSLRHILMADGYVVGTWDATSGKKEVAVQVAPFKPFSAKLNAALEKEKKRYAASLGLPLT